MTPLERKALELVEQATSHLIDGHHEAASVLLRVAVACLSVVVEEQRSEGKQRGEG